MRIGRSHKNCQQRAKAIEARQLESPSLDGALDAITLPDCRLSAHQPADAFYLISPLSNGALANAMMRFAYRMSSPIVSPSSDGAIGMPWTKNTRATGVSCHVLREVAGDTSAPAYCVVIVAPLRYPTELSALQREQPLHFRCMSPSADGAFNTATRQSLRWSCSPRSSPSSNGALSTATIPTKNTNTKDHRSPPADGAIGHRYVQPRIVAIRSVSVSVIQRSFAYATSPRRPNLRYPTEL